MQRLDSVGMVCLPRLRFRLRGAAALCTALQTPQHLPSARSSHSAITCAWYIPHACRDSARGVIVSMVKQLGADYLPYVCEVLRSGRSAPALKVHPL